MYVFYLNMGSLNDDAKLFCRFLFWVSFVLLSPVISAKIPSQISSAIPSPNSDWKSQVEIATWWKVRAVPGQVHHQSPSSWRAARLERLALLDVVHAVAQTILPTNR